MDFFAIRTIAHYEMRTLMRSWFFRIFAGLAIFGLGLFNAALNIESSGSPWVYRAISASIPYANLIILNLGQAIVAVFLASEFLKQDLKNDTVEVIYVRPMSNVEYILGKTLGILAVFLFLNLLILVLGVGFSFASNVSSQRIFPYLVYPLLISLPTLLYILGLSFFIMTVVKNQAVTFILLLGYIALTIFYLNKKAFHLFDFIAYQVPMMYSSISGFANPVEILIHRCVYALLGIGLIFLTMYKLNRLPQTPRFYFLPLYIGILFLTGGGTCIYAYLHLKHEINHFREQTLALNNKYASYSRVSISSCHIDIEHLGNKIKAEAKLVVHNPANSPQDTMIFSLNPGLEIHKLTVDGKITPFIRILQIIMILPSEPLLPADSVEVAVEYSGDIHENAYFTGEKNYEDNFSVQVFRLRKRFAFLQRNFVCLTPEMQWYPVSGAGYATKQPFRHEPDFTRYSLQVKTSAHLTALSQGYATQPEKGTFRFRPEYRLTGISLMIGDYRKTEIQVDSVEYSIYSIRGHDYFTPVFADIKDTLPELIRSLKQEYEVRLGLKYPFRRLTLAEVPLHFALDNAIYSYSSEAIQPEMILVPEKGVLFTSSDFRREQFRRKRDLKNNNEEALPEEIQSDLFREFIKRNFLSQNDQYIENSSVVNQTTFSLFPQYFSFVTRLQSEKWPVLATACEAYMSERNNNAGTTLQWYEDLSQPEKINLELARASLSALLKNGTIAGAKDDQAVTIREILEAKGNQLFNSLRVRLGEKEVDSLMTGLVSSHQHEIIPYNEFSSAFKNRFSTGMNEEINHWYSQESMPGFVISDMSSYRVRDGEATRYQIRFTLTDPENSDGLITLNVELNNPNRQGGGSDNNNFNIDFSRKIYIQARSSWEIGFVFNTEPARMSLVTHISRNLPYNLVIGFGGFSEIRNIKILDGVSRIPFTENKNGKNEVVIDNEDDGFSEHQAGNEAYLKSLVQTGKHNQYKYTSIHSWDPPREWKPVLRSEFYGRYVHSASYTRAGSGERTAAWVADLPVKGIYDVYFYLDKANGIWRRSNKSPDYNFRIYHDQEVEKIIRSSADAEDGWNYLGTFSFSFDSAKVELSNQTQGDMIFADAVKWVRKK